MAKCHIDAFLAIDGDTDFVAFTGEPARQHVAVHFIVFDKQNFRHIAITPSLSCAPALGIVTVHNLATMRCQSVEIKLKSPARGNLNLNAISEGDCAPMLKFSSIGDRRFIPALNP